METCISHYGALNMPLITAPAQYFIFTSYEMFLFRYTSYTVFHLCIRRPL